MHLAILSDGGTGKVIFTRNHLKYSAMTKRIPGISLLLIFLLLSRQYAQAVIYINPGSTPQTYPTAGALMPNSCYSIQADVVGLNNRDFYVSGWTDLTGATNSSRIVWQRKIPNTTTVWDQGQIIVNGSNIEVGSLYFNGSFYILAAYYKYGVGYVLSRYQWTGGGFNPTPFTTLLSPTNPFTDPYKNINMDMYSASEYAIVWSEQSSSGSVIRCVLGHGLTTTQAITLDGTEGGIHPDVAMSKNSGAPGSSYDEMAAHIVYARNTPDPTATYSFYTDLIECAVPFVQVYGTNPSNFTPVFEDVNYIGSNEMVAYPVIDCPDISNFDPFANWAYTYTTDHGIEVRLVDQNASVPPTTKNLVNGVDFGNADISMPYGYFANHSPVLAYNKDGDKMHIGWAHNGYPYPSQSKLLSVEISSDGSTLLSPIDYELISTNPTAFYPQFSKNSRYSVYLYAVFLENNALQRHIHHVWGNSANFKTQPGNIAGCTGPGGQITAAPNPFAEYVRFTIPGTLTDADINATMTDLTGKTWYTGTCKGTQLETTLQPYFLQLPVGTYMLRTSNAAANYDQQQKLIKIR